MSSGFASAREISAQIVRNDDAITARRLMTERIRRLINERIQSAERARGYRRQGKRLGIQRALQNSTCGLYAIAQRSER
jgi:hypothetical protein